MSLLPPEDPVLQHPLIHRLLRYKERFFQAAAPSHCHNRNSRPRGLIRPQMRCMPHTWADTAALPSERSRLPKRIFGMPGNILPERRSDRFSPVPPNRFHTFLCSCSLLPLIVLPCCRCRIHIHNRSCCRSAHRIPGKHFQIHSRSLFPLSGSMHQSHR